MTEAAVKFVDGSDDLIEGLILPYGGPVNGQDLTGSHFTKSTDYAAEWFPDGGRPGLYAHGFDDTLGMSVIGREQKSWKDDKGVWLRAQLDKAHEYWAEIKQLVDAGKVSLSSGAVDHLVRVSAKSGEIKTWPWVEWSLVPTPANPEARVYSVKSADAIEHMAVLGVKAPDELTDDADNTITMTIKADTAQAEAAIASLTDAVKAFQATLTPQSLHDASVASGAKCAHEPGETPVSEPAPVLAVKAGEGVVTATEADLDELRELLRPVAAKAVKEVLRN